MITLKFGGTSMGNARRIIDSATIMKERAEKDRISVVVSAVAGVSEKPVTLAIREVADGKLTAELKDEYK